MFLVLQTYPATATVSTVAEVSQATVPGPRPSLIAGQATVSAGGYRRPVRSFLADANCSNHLELIVPVRAGQHNADDIGCSEPFDADRDASERVDLAVLRQQETTADPA